MTIPSPAPQRDELHDVIIPKIREYGLRHHGQAPIRLTIHFPEGKISVCIPTGPVLSLAEPPTAESSPGPPGGGWASGGDIRMLSDGQRLYHPRLGVFTFSGQDQQAVIKMLFEAWEDGTHYVSQTALQAAGGFSSSLRDLFKSHRQRPFNTLIKKAPNDGSMFRLAVVGDEEEESA